MVKLYEHFGYLEQIKNPGILLGKPIFWTVKEDGSNTAIYFDEVTQRYRVASRNQNYAQFEAEVLALPEVQKVIEFLKWINFEYGSNYTVYGEYMKEGWSPTHLKHYDCSSYKVFDIYDHKKDNFLEYYEMYNLLKPWDIPVVDLIAITTSNSVEHLLDTQVELLKLMDLRNQTFACKVKRFFRRITGRLEEGLVAKCMIPNGHVYFKAKYFIERVRKVKDKNKITLPQLEKGELLKCIYKVKDSLSEDDFKKSSIAMPRIAEEIALELRQTATCNIKYKLFDLYMEVLNEH